MRALLALERRLQDIERKFENKERLGQIVDTKFENNRWYVKLNDGDDLQPSGSQSSADPMKGEGTFKSDWQPWKSFSHGTIKMSIPPKKGQYALMRSSAGGIPELSVVEPHHYGPENPSPHDKHDEVVHLIEDEDEKKDQQGGGSGGGNQSSSSGDSGGGQGGQGQDKWNHWVRQTKDMIHTIIQKKGANMDGMGQLGGLAGMAGLNGLDMSNFAGAIGGLGNIGNIANLNLGNIADFGQLSGMIGNISNFSKFANLGSLAQAAGLGHLTQVGSMLSAISGASGGGSGAGGGSSGGGSSSGGDSGSSGGEQQQKEKKTRKIPEVEEEGHSDTTQIKTTKEFILKTVGDKKSYYRQDNDKIHVRYGEQDKKADIFMDKDQVKVQFKDKKAVVKWTENDLTMQMGEDEKSKVVMTENDITMTQGGNNASKMVMTNGDITISQGEQSSWKLTGNNLALNIGGTQWTLDSTGWNQDGGLVSHNNFNIGGSHRHTNVLPGGGISGFPIPKGT